MRVTDQSKNKKKKGMFTCKSRGYHIPFSSGLCLYRPYHKRCSRYVFYFIYCFEWKGEAVFKTEQELITIINGMEKTFSSRQNKSNNSPVREEEQ